MIIMIHINILSICTTKLHCQIINRLNNVSSDSQAEDINVEPAEAKLSISSKQTEDSVNKLYNLIERYNNTEK